MKWIGQNIYDQISRFRNDVYLENISSGTIASGAHLGLDSNNKIVKAVDGGGDLTSIVAGTGLSGTSLTGPIPTLNVDASQPTITTLAGLTSFGTNGVNTLFSGNSFQLINTTASSATQGGRLQLASNDGAAMGDDHRLGIINFIGVEDASNTYVAGASIAAYADAAWSSTENGTRLLFRTMDGNASGQDVLTLDSNKLATFTGGVTVAGTLTMGSTLAMGNTGLLTVGAQTGITAAANLVTVGTIGTGVWNGTKVAKAYLDDDTAHLEGNQTFSGVKTFAAPIISANNRTIPTIGDGVAIHVDTFDVTDGTTSASATTAVYKHVSIESPRLLATNSSVTTTDAATLYVSGAPFASTNQTITNAYALWVNAGNARFDGNIDLEGDIDVNGTLETDALTIAGATIAAIGTTSITTLGTIGTGTWNATAIASAKMATGTSSAQGALELATTAEATTGTDTARAVTPAGLKAYADRPAGQIVLMRSAFKDDIGTTKHYIPLQSELEQTSATHEMNSFVAPFAGKLLKIMFRGSGNFSASSAEFTFTLEQIPRNVAFSTTATTLETIAIDGPTNNTTDPNMVIANFVGGDGTNAFTAGDIIQVGIQSDTDVTGGSSKLFFTLVFEFDFSGLA